MALDSKALLKTFVIEAFGCRNKRKDTFNIEESFVLKIFV